jgi:hypothetical protein
VCLRLKPLSEAELKTQRELTGSEWHVINETTLSDRFSRELFHFDRVFSADETTMDLYRSQVEPGLKKLLEGDESHRSITVMAYGQTSAGKTYTMSGKPHGLTLIVAREVFGASDKVS